MRIALWDSHHHRVEDFDGGGESVEGQSVLGRLYRYACHQVCALDRQPVAIELAYLAAIFRRLGHTVEYFEDDPPWGDVVLFRPSLATLAATLDALRQMRRLAPRARQWVTGPVAARWPQWFTSRGATVLKGEAEQLLWCFDEVLRCDKPVIHLGCVDDLDALPWPQWSWFEPDRFRLPSRFRGYPVGAVQHSRATAGLRDEAGLSPQMLRYRPAERVVSELRHQIESCGFEAFVFCDPRFAADRRQAWRLVHLLDRLPQRIEFAVYGQPTDLTDDLLTALADVGLSAVGFPVVVADHQSRPDSLAPLRQFVASCLRLGIRTRARLLLSAGQRPAEQYPQALAVAKTIGATQADFAWPLGSEASADAVGRFSLGWGNRYYMRPGYAAQHWRTLLPASERAEAAEHFYERPQTDAAHAATPPPMGGLEIIRRTRGLRTDAPHQRAPSRRKHGSSPHE